MNLSKHFTLEEMVFSQTAVRQGINNDPTPDVIDKLHFVAQSLEQVRELLGGHPIIVSSGYRCPELNAAVGGSKNSDHCLGYAVDFTCPRFGSALAVAKALSECYTISFETLIYEGTWVHMAFRPPYNHRVMTAHFGNLGVVYSEGVTA